MENKIEYNEVWYYEAISKNRNVSQIKCNNQRTWLITVLTLSKMTLKGKLQILFSYNPPLHLHSITQNDSSWHICIRELHYSLYKDSFIHIDNLPHLYVMNVKCRISIYIYHILSYEIKTFCFDFRSCYKLF